MEEKNSLQKRQEAIEKRGANSWEFQKTVKECWESIEKAKERERIKKIEAEKIKRNSTLSMFK